MAEVAADPAADPVVVDAADPAADQVVVDAADEPPAVVRGLADARWGDGGDAEPATGAGWALGASSNRVPPGWSRVHLVQAEPFHQRSG